MVMVGDYVEGGCTDELIGRIFDLKGGLIPTSYRINEIFRNDEGQERVGIDIEFYGSLVYFGDGGTLQDRSGDEENLFFVDRFDF